MFILTRKDVEISTVVHPKLEQPIPILTYQSQTFRLISVFNANQAEEAKAMWRDLTDTKGKACVLLQEADRHSIWGKIRIDQLAHEAAPTIKPTTLIQGALILLQMLYVDIDELLGTRQASTFQKDIIEFCKKGKITGADSSSGLKNLLNMDPLTSTNIPAWSEKQIIPFLAEIHRLGKSYFGNNQFATNIQEILADMNVNERQEFMNWLKQSPLKQLWQ